MKKYILGATLLLALFIHPVAHADTYPDGCTATTAYSVTTGHPCTLPDCAPGDAYSALTGHPCSGTVNLPGCYSAEGFSVTTGTKCDGSIPAPSITNNVTPVVSQSQSQTMSIPDQIPAPTTSDTIVAPVDKSAWVISIKKYTYNNGGVAADGFIVNVTDDASNTDQVAIVSNLDGAQQIAAQYAKTNGIQNPIVVK
jgi:hypothetical protein